MDRELVRTIVLKHLRSPRNLQHTRVRFSVESTSHVCIANGIIGLAAQRSVAVLYRTVTVEEDDDVYRCDGQEIRELDPYGCRRIGATYNNLSPHCRSDVRDQRAHVRRDLSI